MLAILLEHHDLKSARRALIACSAITIFLSGVDINGTVIEFLGLEISIREDQTFAAARIFTTYFFVVYFLMKFGTALDSVQKFIFQIIDRKIEAERSKASSVDFDPEEQEREEERRRYEEYGPPDPWWVDFENEKMKLTKLRKGTEIYSKRLVLFIVSAIEHVPPLALSVSAIFFPTKPTLGFSIPSAQKTELCQTRKSEARA